MTEKLKIGVIGAGVFGGYHVGKCAAHNGVELIGIHDNSAQAMESLASKYDTNTFVDTAELLGQCDAAIIAAPASFHGDLALMALDAGVHILVEKPLATNTPQARAIVAAATKTGKRVQVGHQERFVVRAIGLDKIPERPVLIDARRLSPFNVRGTDTSVTLDLMTHDIDLVHWLMGEYPRHVNGKAFSMKTDSADRSFAHLVFDHGEAFLEASRLAEASSRVMEITYPSGTVRIDFNKKSLENTTPFVLNDDFAQKPDAKDSLAAGLKEFVSAIKGKRAPFISAEAGCMAVEVALKIDGVL